MHRFKTNIQLRQSTFNSCTPIIRAGNNWAGKAYSIKNLDLSKIIPQKTKYMPIVESSNVTEEFQMKDLFMPNLIWMHQDTE